MYIKLLSHEKFKIGQLPRGEQTRVLNFFSKNFSQFFSCFSISKLSTKICSPYDEKCFHMKEAKYLPYQTHQKLFSYHTYNCFKFQPKQNFYDFFMISAILSFNQPRLKINSLAFCKMIFQAEIKQKI